ncbi:hypothetical protein D3C78_1701900 [compost metagenome]
MGDGLAYVAYVTTDQDLGPQLPAGAFGYPEKPALLPFASTLHTFGNIAGYG